MEVKVRRFDQDSLLSSREASGLVNIFKENYPQFHTKENREKDINQRKNELTLNALLMEGRVIFTAHDINEKIIGLLEMRQVDQDQGVYMQLVWIIVDVLARGQKIATKLHQEFQAEAKDRASKLLKPSCLLLSVHPDNCSAKKTYEAWGYREEGRVTEDGKIFMFKDL